MLIRQRFWIFIDELKLNKYRLIINNPITISNQWVWPKILTTTSSDTSESHQPWFSPTLVLPTVALKQVWVFAQWVSSNPNLSWNPSSQSSWLVSWVSTVWSSLSSLSRRVNNFVMSLVPATGYKANAAYAHLASGLCCGFSSLVIIEII